MATVGLPPPGDVENWPKMFGVIKHIKTKTRIKKCIGIPSTVSFRRQHN